MAEASTAQYHPTTIQRFHSLCNGGEIRDLDAFLQRNPIDVNVRDKFGWSALDIAAAARREDMVQYLLRKDAQFLDHDDEYNTKMLWAEQFDPDAIPTVHRERMESLTTVEDMFQYVYDRLWLLDCPKPEQLYVLMHGIDLLQTSSEAFEDDITMLYGICVCNQDVFLSRICLEAGASPNYVCSKPVGITAFFMACFTENILLVQLLLDYGVNPNICNQYRLCNEEIPSRIRGLSPLHHAAAFAAESHLLDCLLELTPQRVDVNIQHGLTSLTPLQMLFMVRRRTDVLEERGTKLARAGATIQTVVDTLREQEEVDDTNRAMIQKLDQASRGIEVIDLVNDDEDDENDE